MKSLLPLDSWRFPLLCGLLAALSAFTADKTTTSSAPAARRILFLGDSITYGGQYVEYFETLLRLRFPDWPGEILNLGLPSETVSGLSEDGHAGGKFPRPDLHDRLARVLAQTQPDLIIACYGMNDGIYLPFDAERFQKFQIGIRKLRAQAATANAHIIHLTPPTFDPVAGHRIAPPATDYNGVLDRYADWLLSQRAHGWAVVDLHGPMNRHLAEHRQRDPGYRLAKDGVHPGETGHWLMARPLLRQFGVMANDRDVESPNTLLATFPNGEELFKVVQQRQRLLKDAWLTATGHQRPGMNPGVPLPQAQPQAEELGKRIRALASPSPVPVVRHE